MQIIGKKKKLMIAQIYESVKIIDKEKNDTLHIQIQTKKE